jgi:hypothetical protein
MTVPELHARLLRENINRNAYQLTDGLPNEALKLNQHQSHWEVYYSERGQKTGLQLFATETEACTYFYTAVKRMLGLQP